MLILKEAEGRTYLFALGTNFRAEINSKVKEDFLLGKKIDENVFGILLQNGIINSNDLPQISIREQSQLIDCEIQLTDKCNLSCPFCFVPKLSNYVIPIEKFYEICLSLHKLGAVNLILTGGEVFFIKNIWEYLNIARDFKLSIKLVTNGTLINKNTVNKLFEYPISDISISIDGFEAIHDKIRGKGTFQKSIAAIHYLQLSGMKPSINVVVGKHNYFSLEGLGQYLIKIGAGKVKFSRLRKHGAYSDDRNILDVNEYSQFLIKMGIKNKKGSNWIIHQEGLNCGASLTSIAIKADGNVLPCFLLDKYIMGNIYKNSLYGIYNNPSSISMWTRHCKWDEEFTLCKNCKIFDVCKGGCRGEAEESGDLSGCDQYSRMGHYIK